MSNATLRELFAVELEKHGETGLASMVRAGTDNSHGGTAALAAMDAAASAERQRCVDIVQAARCGEIDRDFRAIISMIENGSSAEELIKDNAH